MHLNHFQGVGRLRLGLSLLDSWAGLPEFAQSSHRTVLGAVVTFTEAS